MLQKKEQKKKRKEEWKKGKTKKEIKGGKEGEREERERGRKEEKFDSLLKITHEVKVNDINLRQKLLFAAVMWDWVMGMRKRHIFQCTHFLHLLKCIYYAWII